MTYERRPCGTGEGVDIRANITAGAPVPDDGQQDMLALVPQETVHEAACIGVKWDAPALVVEMEVLDEEQAAIVEAENIRLGWRYLRPEAPPPQAWRSGTPSASRPGNARRRPAADGGTGQRQALRVQ